MSNIFKLTIFFIVTFTGTSYATLSQSQLAFVANVVDGSWDIFTVDEDGKNLLRLTSTPYDEKDPSWSLDRTKLVYATSDGYLNILDIKSKDTQKLVVDNQAVSGTFPSFSPDSKKVAFIQFIPGARDDTNLMIFDPVSKTSQRVVDQYAAQQWPAWSPDSRRLVYTSAHCASDCGRIIQELWIADPAGGYARQMLLTGSFCQQPVWSPDGSEIAFSSDKAGNFDIWLLSLKDWKLKQLTNDAHLDVSPAWSPDGKRIAFISTRSGQLEIWIKDLNSLEEKRLKPFGDKTVECKDVAW
jgi:TolB protein